jgi:geranylgeranyl diphosphate synthase type II
MSAAAPASLQEYLKQRQQAVDARLDQLLPPPTERPESIHRAMRHSVFAGGKRIRPILCLESAAVVTAEQVPGSRFQVPSSSSTSGPGTWNLAPGTWDVACALEMIHTYSLIHDDLPALDNDDFRRGVPTCHKAFGEAIAILAGDALLTLAFEVLASSGPAEPERRLAILAEVAHAAGTLEGMIGGQVIDVESERRAVDAETVEYIHRSKTAAMIRAAVRSGAIAAGAGLEQLAALTEYGAQIGLAFQIIDDILDVEGSTASLGKTAGKDAAQQKATYPSAYGLERSRVLAGAAIEQAVRALEPFGGRAHWLREIALYLRDRKN